MDRLAQGMRKDVDAIRKGDTSLTPRLRLHAEIMTSALRLYRTAHESFKRIGELHAEFLVTAESWNRMLDDTQPDSEELQIGPKGRGVRIREKVVRLDEEERKEVCRILVRYLRDQHLEAHETKGLFERRSEKDNPLTWDSARQLVIEVALALEPHIHLSFPQIQRGIGSTLATYLGDLEPGMSANEKKVLAESMAQDVVEDMSQAAEHLAVALVRHYGVNLTDEASEFLHKTYGARQSVLDILSQHRSADAVSQSLLAGRPTVVPPAQRRWYRALVHAKRVVGSERFTPLWVERL